MMYNYSKSGGDSIDGNFAGELITSEFFDKPDRTVTGDYTGSMMLKRAMDVSLGLVFLFLSFPLMAAIAVFIKYDSQGPVFFRQRRVGLRGRTFSILKFRTMKNSSSQADHKEYIRRLMQEQDDEHKPKIHTQQVDTYMNYIEQRTTRIGKFLRATSLDEIPQLFNILAGDMSLVGPRPHPTYEVQQYKDWYLRRLEVKPGLTGWSKLKLRLTPENYEEAILFDLWYVDNWSVLLDSKIILLTIPHVLLRNDAH